jgi:DNA-binding response OmpR family regulator
MHGIANAARAAATSMTRILIVDDAKPLALRLAREFRAFGDTAEAATAARTSKPADCASTALARLATSTFDAVLVDWGLLGMGAPSLCRQIHQRWPQVALIVLFERACPREKLLAFDVGADDCVAKPPHVPELRARIAAILRRSSPSPAVIGPSANFHPPATPDGCAAAAAELSLDELVISVRGKPVEVTPTQARLFAALEAKSGAVLRHDELCRAVWGRPFHSASNVLGVTIRQLRKRLGPDAWLIRTVRGVGYRLATSRHPARAEEQARHLPP